MFNILGWIIIIWLLGSIVYSTQFHLRNYLASKDKNSVVAHQMDGPSHVEIMSKEDFLKKVIGLQLYKAITIIVLLYFLIK